MKMSISPNKKMGLLKIKGKVKKDKVSPKMEMGMPTRKEFPIK